MNYVEEQRNELEVLSEIYYNELKVISEEPPISFSIKICPRASYYESTDSADRDNADSDGESSGSIEDEVASQEPYIDLKFELPEKYPDEKPSIEVFDSYDLEPEDQEEILNNLSEKAEESLGTVMVFTLVSDVVEWLIYRAERAANEIEAENARRLEEDEKEERRKQEGTLVDVKTFLAWKAKFDAELLKIKLEQEKKQQSEQGGGVTGRLTGRQMFESDKTLAESDINFVEDLEQDQIEALLQNIDDVDLEDQDYEPSFDDSDEDEEFDEELDEEDSDEEDDDREALSKEKKNTVPKR